MTTTTSTTPPPAFHTKVHSTYISQLPKKLSSPDSYEGAVTEHLRMSGIYWSLTALSLLHPFDEVNSLMNVVDSSSNNSSSPKQTKKTTSSDDDDDDNDTSSSSSIISFVMKCYDPQSGGFGGNVGHDPHMLYTLSAIQILALGGRLDLIDVDEVVNFISRLQQDDGSFTGDEWGEIDTRFSYCAVAALSLLGKVPRGDDGATDEGIAVDVDFEKAGDYILSCRNFDGGFGCVPGAESHAGQIFCCVGALAILGRLGDLGDDGVELLCWWLAERQCDSGGLNGRPEKQADVCYSWWIVSSLSILGRVEWINTDKLAAFILRAQDDEDGGIADRPQNMPDVFHTFFGISGLSLVGYFNDSDEKQYDAFRRIDPVYALPTDVVQNLNLTGQVMTSSKGHVDDRLKMYRILPCYFE